MENMDFAISRLLPDFSLIFSGEFTSSAGFSAIVVALILVVALIFLGFALIKSIQSMRQVRFYNELIDSIDKERLASQQRELTQKAKAHPHREYGELWKEFDETLVTNPDNDGLFNTLDAAHFFNTHNLAYGLTENRLLAAVPGFLTALGVLGTFAGLQMGLSGLELNKNAGVEVLQSGIAGMISGASIAFMTSVWGVGSSVIFNLIEKIFERWVRSGITKLERRIDHIYPRINAEQSLVAISKSSQTGTEALQVLGEKIGDRMQEALSQVSIDLKAGFESSLNQVMKPAVDTLIKNAENSSKDLMDQVMDKFMDGVGDAGTQQKELMQSASQEMKDTVAQLGNEVTGFVDQLRQQSVEAEKRDEMRAQTMNQALSNAIGSTQQIGEQMQNQLVEQINAQRQIDDQRQATFEQSMGSLQEYAESLTKRVEQLIAFQQKTVTAIMDRVSDMENGLSAVVESNVEAASLMVEAGQQLGKVATNSGEAASLLGKEIANAVDVSKNIAETNERSAKLNQGLFEELGRLKDDLIKVTQYINETSTHAEKCFETIESSMQSFVTSLGKQVGDLEDNVVSLLDGYANRVNIQTGERMTEWNKHTSEYTGQMTRAVQALSNVVASIEDATRAAS